MSKQHRTIVFVRLKKIIVIKHVVVVNKGIHQNNISSLTLKLLFQKIFQALSLNPTSVQIINTVDESPNKSSFSFPSAATPSYKCRGGHLLTLSLQQGPLFTSANKTETCN